MATIARFEALVRQLDIEAEQILSLAHNYTLGKKVQPFLANVGQSWYRSARELLVQSDFSGLAEFEQCYANWTVSRSLETALRAVCDMDQFFVLDDSAQPPTPYWLAQAKIRYTEFIRHFRKARSLLSAAVSESKARESTMRAELSFTLVSDEFQIASEILNQAGNNEALLRASGVVGRVALERHLFTVADAHKIPVKVNPPSKAKPDATDALNTLAAHSLVTSIQKSELETLFRIGNFCAHPREVVTLQDVQRMLTRGRELVTEIR